MNQDMTRYVNGLIMRQAALVSYRVSANAPSTEVDLYAMASGSLVIWSGESDNTIFDDATVNWGFRAIHDALHLATGLGFSPDHEVELARIQASQYDSTLMQELVFCEVGMQAAYFKKNGVFVPDQKAFTMAHLDKMGLLRK